MPFQRGGGWCYGIALVLNLSGQLAKAQTCFAFEHPQMGTLFRVLLWGADSLAAQAAAQRAFATIDALNATFSDYQPDSEVTQLSQRAYRHWQVVSHNLYDLLQTSQKLARQSGGAFDVTVGPLSKLWRRAFRQQSFPPAAELKAARLRVGHHWLKLRNGRIKLSRANMHLDFGGIAKGYAVDQAFQQLQSDGFTALLVSGGGDIRVGAAAGGTLGWSIAATAMTERGSPSDTLLIRTHCALSTSGDTYQHLVWNNRRYAHLIDPRTGLGVTHQLLVRVEAPTSTLADALATTLSILGPQRGQRWIKRHYPQAQVSWIQPKRQ